MTTQQEQEAPTERQVELLIGQIVELKNKLEGNRIILKEYPIRSGALKNLKQKRKELTTMINEEKERIEAELFEDKDFEEARNDKLTLKVKLKDKSGELKQALRLKHKVKYLYTEDHIVGGAQMRLQLEYSPKVYINGKEFK